MPESILIVDDEPLFVESLTAVLEEEGYEVQQAEDGEVALARQSDAPADVILCGVMMTRLDGYTLVEKLRSRGDPTPVILMSASGVPRTDKPNVWSVGKPFDVDLVLDLVASLVSEGARSDSP